MKVGQASLNVDKWDAMRLHVAEAASCGDVSGSQLAVAQAKHRPPAVA